MKLLDTDVCIAFLNGADEIVRDRLLAERAEELALCSVVKAELHYGARNSQRVQANLHRLQQFFAPFVSFPFDDVAATRCGELRATLRRAGTPIGGNDMMIAAIALATDTTLVTRDFAEFARVPALRLETW